MIKKLILLIALLNGYITLAGAQTPPFTGVQNRVVVFARFDGDPELDTPRSTFETLFNAEDNSLKSYFQAISNDKLTLNSLLYPANTDINSSYELKYCYYCYDSTWKGNYPNCKGNDITSIFDVNIGFIIKELAEYMEATNAIPDDAILDSNNDGYIDNFVIVFRGAGRGNGKGIYTPQTGTISSTFTNTNGEIQLKGKTIHNYTITFERNSLESHCRFQLSTFGFPKQYRNLHTLPRVAGAWDPMDGPQLSYPLVYNRMKYTNKSWIESIPIIEEPGEYTLSSANHPSNNAYRILSTDSQQYWIVEYRDNSATWETNLPESGLIIYRVNTTQTGSNTATPEVYLYRKDGTPTASGDINQAPFSNSNGRTAFTTTSNPYSFLTDGTVFDELDITDITFKEDKMSFRINKVYYTGIQTENIDDWKTSFDLATQLLEVEGEGIKSISLLDVSGRNLFNEYLTDDRNTFSLHSFLPGIYIVKLKGENKEKTFKVLIRE